jgi:hypothetical protein
MKKKSVREFELKEMKLTDHKCMSPKEDKSTRKVVSVVFEEKDEITPDSFEESECEIITLNTDEFLTERREFFLSSFPKPPED